jgi:hypothetical protein
LKNFLTLFLHIILAVSTFSSSSMLKAHTYDSVHTGLNASTTSVVLANVGYSDYIDVHMISKDGSSIDVQKTAAWSVDNIAVAIADSGRILALKKGSAVVTASYNGYKINIDVTVKNNENLEKKYAINNGTVISTGSSSMTNPSLRNQILKKCSSMINNSWSPTKNLIGFDHFIFKAGGTYSGIPYTYSDDLCDENKFTAALSSKYFYKNVVIKSVSQPYFGSDCSGFVCLAWSLSERYDTESLVDFIKNGTFSKVGSYSAYTPNVNDLKKAYAKLQPGDAVVMREVGHGHTYIIADNEPTMSPPQIFAYEQTPPYCQFTNHTYDDMASHEFMPFTLKTLK